ncbi:MAG: beta-N-acetylhexosaminidase [Nitrospirae bacterium]|nr:beta-N-acetylhexosaminidase [Nitrospirota bacterium]
MSNLRRDVGTILMIGYEGPEQPVLDALADGRAGGVILFSRNVESARQVRALTRRLRAAAGRAIPIGIDQEGGRVARLDRAGLPAGPTARAIAAGGDPDAAYRWGLATGRFLKDLGIDLNFAPVLDVDTNPANPIIGDRAYGRTPDVVTAFAAQAIRGLHAAGVTACGKHFPGHGDTELDSHLALPTVRHPADRLERVELAPYAALMPILKTIMTAHVVYPAWDPHQPATFSHEILTGLLKHKMGFEGVVISDDLEMAAVAQNHTPPERAVKAILAGADMLLICRQRPVWENAFEGILAAAKNDGILARRVADAANRVRRVFGTPLNPI